MYTEKMLKERNARIREKRISENQSTPPKVKRKTTVSVVSVFAGKQSMEDAFIDLIIHREKENRKANYHETDVPVLCRMGEKP